MKKENKDGTTFKWRQLFKKRWFFPALYITLAALLLTVVVWYQNLDNRIPMIDDQAVEVSDHYTPVDQTGEEPPEVEEEESILKPVSKDTDIEIVTKYYDYDADETEQEDALILFENHYSQSKGIDIVQSDGESFDVLASLSGTVTTVKDDPVLGTVVIISHDDGVETYYSSLTDVQVQEGMEVSQGDLLASAGKNVYGKDHGYHLHFEIRKDNVAHNPEEYFNESVASLMLANQDADDNEEVDDEVDDEEDPIEDERDQ